MWERSSGIRFLIVAMCALALGAAGARAVNMYDRHTEQHRLLEQFMREQQQLNQQVVVAISQLQK